MAAVADTPLNRPGPTVASTSSAGKPRFERPARRGDITGLGFSSGLVSIHV